MKLLFLTPRLSSLLGGVERHVRLVKKELERRGHQIEELSLKGPGPVRWGLAIKNAAWGKLWDSRHLIRESDAVHVHDVFWWYLPFRFFYPNTRVFTTFHGWEGVYPPTKSAILQKKLAQRLSWGTIGVGTFFEKWYGVKPMLSTFGALEPETREIGTRAKVPEKIKTVAFFGRLEQVNGIDVVLSTFSELRKRKYQILYIGDGSWRAKAEKVGMVTGMVKNPWRFILKSDLVITSSYLSMLETAVLSRPIVSVATNPLKRDYLLTHPLAPYITIVSSPRELLYAIETFDISKHQSAIQNARSCATEQTPRKLADLYEKLWKDTM